MQLREIGIWVKIRESMWFLPLLLVIAALGLSLVTIHIDTAYPQFVERWLPLGFDGDAQGARLILSTIAGAMATIVSIAFSMAIIVLQLAAGQYSPHVITTFRRDRGQQLVLGTYVATFGYALMVLRQVRGPRSGQDEVIPELSMLVALVLAMVCLGMLVYFVHHTSEQMRVSDIAARIHSDLAKHGEHLYPEGLGQPYQANTDDDELIEALDQSSQPRILVRSHRSGYLRLVHSDKLCDLACAPVDAIRLRVGPGDFVLKQGALVELHLDSSLPEGAREELAHRARRCFEIGPRPTLTQDPDLATQQLVDIALRALSPGINDPTTAEQVLAQLGDWIARLARRSFPSQVRCVNERMIVLPRSPYEMHVREAFDQVRRIARTQIHVLHCMLDVFAKICETDPPPASLRPLRKQVEAIDRVAVSQADFDAEERRALRAHVRELLEMLPPNGEEES